MSYRALLSPHTLALLSDWLAATNELYVDVYCPHSGGSSTPYFIHTMQDLKELLTQQSWPELSLTIFRQPQYPLRGVVNTELVAQALNHIPEDTWYHIVPLDHVYPSPCTFLGRGDSHAALKRDLAELMGQQVRIGINPFDYGDEAWRYAHPDEVFTLTVRKNQTYYAPYAQRPERYQWLEELWWA